MLANLLYMSMLLGGCALLDGCGLKGDLYLEQPDPEKDQPVDTADADPATTADDAEQAIRIDGTEQQPAKEDADDAAAPSRTPASAEAKLPAPLTEQDSLQEAQQQSEADIGDSALENVSPDDDQEESSDESAAIESPALP
jgi:predicted small lipoprotein YifL